MQLIPLAKLILDWRLYPRHEVDAFQVRRMVVALGVGEDFPPILVDRTSLRIVDGYHRYHAFQRAKGEDAEIACTLKGYENDQDMFLDAVRLNARHGVPFEPADRARSVIIAQEIGVPLEALAEAITVPVAHLEDIRVSKLVPGPDGQSIYVKTPLRGLGLTAFNRGQVGANKRMVGMRQAYFVARLLDLLRNDLVNWKDAKMVALLRELKEELERLLVVV